MRQTDKPVLHLMVNNTCSNDCPLCCNKQYNVDEIPVVTVEELKNVDTICLTGGQPMYSIKTCIRLCNEIEHSYKNIKQIFIYVNGAEFLYSHNEPEDLECLVACSPVKYGLTMSPKCENDWNGLELLSKEQYLYLFKSNRIYCFSNKEIERAKEVFSNKSVEFVKRVWQKDFVPAPNTIFRRLPIWLI